jgi:hypothetical protein
LCDASHKTSSETIIVFMTYFREGRVSNIQIYGMKYHVSEIVDIILDIYKKKKDDEKFCCYVKKSSNVRSLNILKTLNQKERLKSHNVAQEF